MKLYRFFGRLPLGLAAVVMLGYLAVASAFEPEPEPIDHPNAECEFCRASLAALGYGQGYLRLARTPVERDEARNTIEATWLAIEGEWDKHREVNP